MPPRYSSIPKRRRSGSRWSKDGIGRAWISISAGAAGRLALVLRRAFRGSRRRNGQHRDERDRGVTGASPRMAALPSALWGPDRENVPTPATRRSAAAPTPRGPGGLLVEQLGELVGHGAAELLGVDDGDGAAVVARHVVADADRDQLDRRAGLDVLDHPAQMAFEIIAGIDRQRRSRRPAHRRRSSSGS